MARTVQYLSNVKVNQLNKANLAGVGQNGTEPPGSIPGSSENIKKISKCSFTIPQAHIFTEGLSTTAAHILCKQSAVSLCCLWDTQEFCCLLQLGRPTIVVFTENHHAEFAQEEKEDTISLIHVHLQWTETTGDLFWCVLFVLT